MSYVYIEDFWFCEACEEGTPIKIEIEPVDVCGAKLHKANCILCDNLVDLLSEGQFKNLQG